MTGARTSVLRSIGDVGLNFLSFLPPFFTGEVPRRGDGGNNSTLTQDDRLSSIERQEASTSPASGGRKEGKTSSQTEHEIL